MNKSIPKYLFVLMCALAGLATLAVLPDFTVRINADTRLEWKGLSSIGISNNLFNFLRGSNIFASKQVELTAGKKNISDTDYNNRFERDKQAINARLASIQNLIDAEVIYRHYQDGKRSVILKFPEYVTSPETLAKDLVGVSNSKIILPNAQSKATEEQSNNASLIGLYFNGYIPEDSNLGLSGVEDFSITTSSVINGPVLRTKFNDSVRNQLAAAFNQAKYDPNTGNPIYPIVIMSNDAPIMWAIHPALFRPTNQANEPFPTEIIWVPLQTNDRTNLGIQASTLFGAPLQLTYEGGESSTQVSGDYNPEGLTTLIIAVGLIILLTAIYLMRSIPSIYRIWVTVAYLSNVVSALALMKFFNFTLDHTVVATFAILSMMTAGMLILIIKSKTENWLDVNKVTMIAGITLFLISALLVQIPVLRLSNAMDVLLVFSLLWMLGTSWYTYSSIKLALQHEK